MRNTLYAVSGLTFLNFRGATQAPETMEITYRRLDGNLENTRNYISTVYLAMRQLLNLFAEH